MYVLIEPLLLIARYRLHQSLELLFYDLNKDNSQGDILIMPLYELIMITKCSQPVVAANLMRNITKFICNEGGNVREVKILADRLLAKEMKSADRQPTLIGRYNQILFDGPPSMMPLITKEFKLDKNVLKINFFKVKDFYSHAKEYNKSLESQIADQNKSPLNQAARRIAILKENGG